MLIIRLLYSWLLTHGVWHALSQAREEKCMQDTIIILWVSVNVSTEQLCSVYIPLGSSLVSGAGSTADAAILDGLPCSFTDVGALPLVPCFSSTSISFTLGSSSSLLSPASVSEEVPQSIENIIRMSSV